MRFHFSNKIWLFLAGAFSLGLSQAFMALFLNFYLEALGLRDSHTGLVNALPALTAAALSLPAVFMARRLGEVQTLKIGAAIGLVGIFLIAFANALLMAVAGSLLQGIGSSFIMVTSAPFMTRESTAENRVTLFSLQMALVTGAGFIGNYAGGFIPQQYASFAGIKPTDLAALRAAIIGAALFQLVGALAALFIKNDHRPGTDSLKSLQIENKKLIFKFAFPGVMVGFGAGMTIPYLNIFVEHKFAINYQELGAMFAWMSLATMATVMIQPALVRRFGQLKTGLMVEVASLPFLVMMAFSPYLWMVVIAMFTRGALMNATGPAYSSYVMERLSENDRPLLSAVNMIGWNASWAVSAFVSGVIRDAMGKARLSEAFNILFTVTLVMYALSMFLKYVWLYLPDKREREGI